MKFSINQNEVTNANGECLIVGIYNQPTFEGRAERARSQV